MPSLLKFMIVVGCVVGCGAPSDFDQHLGLSLSARFYGGGSDVIAGEYIVMLDDRVVANGTGLRTEHRLAADVAGDLARSHGGAVRRVFGHALRGFVVRMSESDARDLAADPRVTGVYQNATLSAPLNDCSVGVSIDSRPLPSSAPQALDCSDPDPQNLSATCNDNWGLDRIDQRDQPRDGEYSWPRNGQGVHIYLIESGVYAQHREFQGRVGAGYNVTDGSTDTSDCGNWSHGSHVAGIAAGSTYGVAKGATLHAIKVWDCVQGMTVDNYVAAIDWIYANHAAASGPAVVNMSLNNSTDAFTSPTGPLGTAVSNLANQRNILVVNAAGNHAEDACGWTIGAPEVLIAGGIDEHDAIWARVPGDPNYDAWCASGGDCGSDFGPCVDIWAPAAHIVSSWYGATPDPGNTCRLSGTSMAAPHVVGAAALYLQEHPDATTEQVKQALIDQGTKDLLSGLGVGSPNVLLSIMETAPTAAAIELVPAGPVDFGTIQLGVGSAETSFTASNTGTGDLLISALTFTGVAASDFEITSDACTGVTVGVGQTCAIAVTFSPTALGERNAELVINSNAVNTPELTVALHGSGRNPHLTVTLAGTGQGLVKYEDSPLSCPSNCQRDIPPDTQLLLTAEATAGSHFSAWSVAACGDTPSCPVTVTTDLTVVASFDLDSSTPADTITIKGGCAHQTTTDSVWPSLLALLILLARIKKGRIKKGRRHELSENR